MTRYSALWTILVVLCPALVAIQDNPVAAQTLDRFEDQFKKEKNESPPPAQRKPPSDPSTLEPVCTSVFDCLVWQPIVLGLGEGLWYVITQPFVATLSGREMLLSRYPYERPDGNYLVGPSADGGRIASVDASVAYHAVNERTRGLMADIQLRTSTRFGGDIGAIRYNEDTAAAQSTLTYTEAYLTLTPSESEVHAFDFGFGVMGLSGQERHVGPAFSLRWLWVPHRPWSLSLKTGIGRLDSRALWDLSGKIGIHIGRAELFVGYRSLLGPEDSLNGPTIGAAVWF